MKKIRKLPIFFVIIAIFNLSLLTTNVSGVLTGLNNNNNLKQMNSTEIEKFSSNILLSTNDSVYAHHVEPSMVISNNNSIFVAWKNADEHSSGGIRVSFTSSSDGGENWKESYDMPMFEEFFTGQSDPWLQMYEDDIYFAYLEYSRDSRPLSQITMAKSTDFGKSWHIVASTQAEGFADKETFTISNDGTIYLVYDDIVDDVSVGRLSRSDDNGESFQEVSTIFDEDNFDDLGMYVVTDQEENIYVSWTKFNESNYIGDIHFDFSTNLGENFGKDKKINSENKSAAWTSSNGLPSKITLPVLAFDSNERLYLAWTDLYEPSGTWDIYLKYSEDYGKTWSDRIQVNENVEGHQWMVDFAIDSTDKLHFVWLEEKDSTYKPKYRNLMVTNEEYIFSETLDIATDTTDNIFTRPGDYLTVRVDINDIPHVVWSDGREFEMDIYYSHGVLTEKDSISSTTTSNPSLFLSLSTLISTVIFRRKKQV